MPAVQVAENDVKVVMNECDIYESEAQSFLRANGGNLREALLAFLRH